MYGDRQNICQVLQKSDHRKEKAMEIRKNSGPLKWILIGISTLFLIVMLILPLTYVLVTAFGEGIKVFVASVTDYYALKAIGLTSVSYTHLLLENRQVIAEQLDAMAYIMQDCAREERVLDTQERRAISEIRYRAKERGISIEEIHLIETLDGRLN